MFNAIKSFFEGSVNLSIFGGLFFTVLISYGYVAAIAQIPLA